MISYLRLLICNSRFLACVRRSSYLNDKDSTSLSIASSSVASHSVKSNSDKCFASSKVCSGFVPALAISLAAVANSSLLASSLISSSSAVLRASMESDVSLTAVASSLRYVSLDVRVSTCNDASVSHFKVST